MSSPTTFFITNCRDLVGDVLPILYGLPYKASCDEIMFGFGNDVVIAYWLVMNSNSVDHEATFGVYHTTCLEVHTDYIVNVETGTAASVESETKLRHICNVLLCEVARLEVQVFTPHLKAEALM